MSAPKTEPQVDTTPIDDATAAARCPGDGSAFRVIYERHAPSVLRFLERLLGDPASAEDALQETFVRLYRWLDAWDRSRPLAPYVLRIARNVAIDLLRSRKYLPLKETAARPEANALEAEERRQAVVSALDALAPEHRAVLVLRLVEGLKLEDVAEALSCTPRTARNRLRAASVLLERELRTRGVIRE